MQKAAALHPTRTRSNTPRRREPTPQRSAVNRAKSVERTAERVGYFEWSVVRQESKAMQLVPSRGESPPKFLMNRLIEAEDYVRSRNRIFAQHVGPVAGQINSEFSRRYDGRLGAGTIRPRVQTAGAKLDRGRKMRRA